MRWLLPALLLVGCTSQNGPAANGGSEAHEMARPRTVGEHTLEQLLQRRRSVREFTDARLTDAEIAQLCWAAQGVTGDEGQRTAPSAGALYPLELYVLSADGVFHYLPQGHKLRRISDDDARPALYAAALEQEAVRDAPAVFVIAADYQRTSRKYGDRAERYVYMEAGHAAQNLLLQAVALGLGGVPIGAFDDNAAHRALALSRELAVLYLLPVGHPAREA